MDSEFGSSGGIFQRSGGAHSALFDPQVIREFWVPVAAAWRRSCGHYHDVGLLDLDMDDPRRWTSFPQTSSVVFATNGFGTVAAVRIRNGEYVGIISMLNLQDKWTGFEIPQEASETLLIWLESILLQLT